MRIDNSIKNLKYNTIATIIYTIISFVTRTFFVKYLGKEYLGVNGLFSNILTILSLADLGISSVLIYSMYKPLAEKDEEKLKKLTNEYRKIYNVIALVVLVVGLSLTPFLNIFIKNENHIPNIQLIYILYLSNTVVSYLCIYKISIINADQKGYLVTLRQQLFNIIANIIMILSLVIWKNFIVYLIIQILFSIISNIYLSKYAEKLYPCIKDIKGHKLEDNDKKEIKKNTLALMCHKVGGVVVGGTDNVIISAVVGLKSVGMYSNYLMITRAINKFATQFFNSIVSSVGNLNVEKDKNYLYDIFKKIHFLNAWIYIFSTVCLINLFNPFIKLWLGIDYVFSFEIVLVIALNFYVDGMRQTVLSFKDAMGIFWSDRFKPIIEAVVNLVVSLILAYKFGIIGVLLGTTISFLFVAVWIESLVLYRDGFNKKWIEYVKIYIKEFLILCLCTCITILINSLINGSGILWFALRCIITSGITAFLLIMINIKNSHLKYYINLLRKKFLKVK